MLQYEMNAQVRTAFGKSASKSLRREGISPAIMYGPKSEALAIQLETKALTKIMLELQRRNAVFSLDVSGGDAAGKRHVMVKDIQTNPVDDSLVHTDFMEVSLEEPITLNVPIKYTGVSQGVDLGGELHVSLNRVAVKGLVLDIPDFFEIDITPLAIGDSFNCDVITVPAGVELLNNSDDLCVSVAVAKRQIEEDDEVEADAPAAAEPAEDAA